MGIFERGGFSNRSSGVEGNRLYDSKRRCFVNMSLFLKVPRSNVKMLGLARLGLGFWSAVEDHRSVSSMIT